MKPDSYSGVEHISSPAAAVLSKTLDRMVSNFGREEVIKNYIEPVLKEKNSSRDILEFPEFYKTLLYSGINC